jgi:hypothetical protein
MGVVCCVCCVLSGRGLCDELITRPEEFYRLWRVVCDQETSWYDEAIAIARWAAEPQVISIARWAAEPQEVIAIARWATEPQEVISIARWAAEPQEAIAIARWAAEPEKKNQYCINKIIDHITRRK